MAVWNYSFFNSWNVRDFGIFRSLLTLLFEWHLFKVIAREWNQLASKLINVNKCTSPRNTASGKERMRMTLESQEHLIGSGWLCTRVMAQSRYRIFRPGAHGESKSESLESRRSQLTWQLGNGSRLWKDGGHPPCWKWVDIFVEL